MDESTSYLDVLVFYGRYYDGIHLPKHVKLEPAKSQRLEIWRKLVASVNGIKKTCQLLSELTVIEKEILMAITPIVATRSRPMSMCDPDDEEDGARLQVEKKENARNAQLHVTDSFDKSLSAASMGLSFYKSEWQGIAQVIDALRKLRDREKEQSQKLDDALHSRELLASFSSKASPSTSRVAPEQKVPTQRPEIGDDQPENR
mmetsp:Transcript_23975/g.44808  ORF Transcript_23975/g.44808 Transcript_23975/m.44808 type:complete len:203 (+) Transcript_23975:106-714(+)